MPPAATRVLSLGVAAGLVALAATLAGFARGLVTVPINLGLVVGLVAGLASIARLVDRRPTGRTVAAMLPAFGAPVLVERLAQSGLRVLPLVMFRGLALHASAAALGFALWGLIASADPVPEDRVDLALGLVTSTLLALLLGVLLFRTRPGRGALVLVAVAVVGVTACLGLQARLGHRLPVRRASRLQTAAPLAAAGSQLLDGWISWLAVTDPLEVLEDTFSEQVAVSGALLEYTGPGFVAAKWLLALVFAYFAESPAHRTRGIAYTGSYLLVGFLGLAPGLFSLTQLFA